MVKPQLVSPAQLGRLQRIEQFKQFIEDNRKTKNSREIVNLYSLQTGLAPRLLRAYLRTLYIAGIFQSPNTIIGSKIVTQEEYEELAEEWKRKRKEKVNNSYPELY